MEYRRLTNTAVLQVTAIYAMYKATGMSNVYPKADRQPELNFATD